MPTQCRKITGMGSRILFFLALFGAMSSMALGSGTSQISEKTGFDHSAYDSILQSVVFKVRAGQGTLVDYQKLRSRRPALENYLADVSSVDGFYFDQWAPDERLAFLINVYNAKTLDVVLTKYPELESIKDLGSIFSSVWSKDVIELFGRERSLDYIEHTLIRGDEHFGGYGYDPRIHFAVNCASIGCPGLHEHAYTGQKMQSQLDVMTRRFLGDRANNALSSGELSISKIFDWYGEDFEKGWRDIQRLEDFLVMYKEPLGMSDLQAKALLNGQIPIEYSNYDWNLNDGRSPND